MGKYFEAIYVLPDCHVSILFKASHATCLSSSSRTLNLLGNTSCQWVNSNTTTGTVQNTSGSRLNKEVPLPTHVPSTETIRWALVFRT